MQAELFAAIAQYQEDVFEYRPADMALSFLRIIDALEYWVDHIFGDEDQPYLNQVLQIMLTAYQDKDYLLAADLAEYELKPLAIKAQDGRGNHVALR